MRFPGTGEFGSNFPVDAVNPSVRGIRVPFVRLCLLGAQPLETVHIQAPTGRGFSFRTSCSLIRVFLFSTELQSGGIGPFPIRGPVRNKTVMVGG